jgi:orotidine-5'-phosphate decarboxylase
MAKKAGCAGVVCSGLEAGMLKANLGKTLITVTPGIRPQWSLNAKDDQKRVTTPAQAVGNGSDYLVIGRPIRDASDVRAAAMRVAEEIAATI